MLEFSMMIVKEICFSLMISVRLLILKITKISNALLNTLFLSKLKDDRLLHTARFARALRYAALTPKLVGKG